MASEHTLWDIGQLRPHHPSWFALLGHVARDAAEEPSRGGVGIVDRGYARLNAFQASIGRLKADEVAAVAGEGAARALRDIEADLVLLRRGYALRAGPDRTTEEARRSASRLSGAVARIRDNLAAYDASVSGLVCPAELPPRPVPRGRAPAARTVPSVPLPRPREATSAMARVVLGETYTTLAVACVEASVAGEVTRAVRLDLTALSGRLGTWSDSVAYRARADDAPFVDAVRRACESLDNALDAVIGGRPGPVSPTEALSRCADMAAQALRQVDRMRGALGHADPDPDEAADAASGPRP